MGTGLAAGAWGRGADPPPFAGMLCRPALDWVWECLDVLAACLGWADELDDPTLEVHALPV